MLDLIMSIDNGVADFMISIHNGFLTAIFTVITFASEKGLIWILIGIGLLICKKTRKFGIVYAITLACAFLFSEYTVKLIVCRERPFIARDDIKLLISPPSGYSFPSSHSCSSFSCAVCMKLNKKRFAVPALVLAVLVAISRVYFTVHYFTDVIVGAVFGTLWAIIIFAVSRKIENRKKSHKI